MPASTVLSPISATHLNSSGAASAKLVLTFNDDILAGTGLMTISDGSTQTYIGRDGTLRTRLIGATDTRTIDITDTSKVSISGNTITISLDSNLSAGKNYSVQMAKGVLLDEGGSVYAGLTDTSKLQFSTSTTPLPSAVIDSGFAFKYDTGHNASDFITKTALQTVGGNYTGALAADEFIEVSLDNGRTWLQATVANDAWSVEGTLSGASTIIARVSNAAGGHSAAVRQAYTLDTEAPAVVALTLSDADLVAGETATVTVTFNEAVTGLALADFAVTGGVLSNLATADNGKTWTVTLTPTINVPNGVGQVTLIAAGVDDVAGNSGPANATHAPFVFSTVPNQPAALVTSASMADSGSSNSDFITNSTAQTVKGAYSGALAADEYIEVSLDGGTTWTKATAASGNWSIPATTISASNTQKARVTNGYTYSNPLVEAYTLDQAGPTVAITLADSTIGIGETSLVTFTFSEAVANFSNDDVTVSGGTLSAVSSADGGITWTAAFTPSASTTALSNAITVNKAGLTDIAGNAGSGTANSANYAVDTVRPLTSSISLADATLSAGETTTVTITFSEVVTDLSIADLTVANGTLSALSPSDAGLTWTATLTPAASVDHASNVITLDNTGIADTAGNAGSGTTSSGNYTLNTVRPAATTISVADTKLTAGETTTVTIVFNKAVTELPAAALTVANGTLSAPATADNGMTWTATLTPSVSADASSNVITLNNTAIKDASGNAGTGTTSSASYAVATRRPEVDTIAVSKSTLKAGDTATVTVTLKEAVSGPLAAADFTIDNGTLSEPVSADNGLTWTATLTPSSSIEDTANTITLNNTGFTDSDGNSGAGSTSSANYAVDTVRPLTSSISLADTTLSAGETTTATFTFSEAVTGLTAAAVTVANGALSAPVSADGGITWSATLTPAASVANASNILTLDNTVIADSAGNAGGGTTSSGNYTVDTKRPTVGSITVADSKLTAGETTTVTITFTEAVSGLAAADFTIDNGTLSEPVSTDNGVTWIATLTPTANIEDTANSITLDNTGFKDSKDNTGSGTASSANYTVDTKRPTASISISDTALKIGDTATVTVTFTEAVSGLAAADFTIDNGILSKPVSADNGLTWTATPTSSSSIEDTANTITLNNTGFTDSDGNSGAGSTSSANYAVDTVRPLTSSISLADTTLSAGETTTATFTFSEAVTALTAAAVTVANGALSAPVSADGGITWSATLTPTASVANASNILTLDNTVIADSAGNAGSGTTSSGNYTVDTKRPTIGSITVADSKLTAGETTTVTITFSEAVSNLTTADLSVDNGTLSTPVSSDNGITWTTTLTPFASTDDTSNVIMLNNAGVTDSAGNSGTGTTSSGSYTVATRRPTVDSITVSDSALKAGDTATVAITFSEAVSGLAAADFNYGHGTLSAPVTTDNGLTWIATLTPTSDTESTLFNSITLDNRGVTDSDGNTGSGSTMPVYYTVDTSAPTATIALSDSTLDMGETATVTITFSEAVSDFSSGDLAVSGGTLGTLTTSDNITWTATLTPQTTGSGSGSIALAASSVADAAGNSGPSSASNASFSYAVPPTTTVASVALSADTGTSGDFITHTASQTITGTISAALSGSEFVEVSLNAGVDWTVLPSFTGTSWSWSGQTLSGSNTLMARVSNSSGSGVEFSQPYQLDQTAPTATITLSESALLVGETATATITFSEAVSGLALSDFKASGTLSALTSNSNGTVWTVTLAANGSGEIRLDPSAVTDVAGNSGPATAVYAYYTYNAKPAVTIASASMTDPHNHGDFITSSTSQVISGKLSAALGRGQFVEVSLNNGATWARAETVGTNWTLSGQTISGSNTLIVRTSNGSVTGTAFSHAYTLDQAAPVLSSISIDKSALLSGETATVTVVFNEDVTGLTADDFAISGASLGTFSTTDNRTWTSTLTPTASGSVALSSSTVSDTAGNAGPVANSETKSFTFTVDNTAPSATLTLGDITLVKNQTTTLTLTLTEAVTDTPTASDFTVVGGSLGTFTSADGGTTWTATLTPTAGAYGQGGVTLNAGTITDPSSNAGPSSNVSLPFNYDTQTLSLASSIAFSTDIGSSTSDLITNTGTQTISGSFSGGAIYALMGAKIEVSTDNGETWSDATIDNTAHTWSISKTLSGSSYVKVKLTDGSGVTGTPDVYAYTIDSTGPGSLAGRSLDLLYDSDSSNPDAGGSHYDNITNDDTPTIRFSVSGASVVAGDYIDVLDTSNDNAILGTYTIQSSDLSAYGSSFDFTPEAALSEGTHTLVLRARDTAGNTGTQSSAMSITIDKTLASMADKTLDLAAASDSGGSSTDNITNDNTPDVTFNIANTSGLAAGDKLEVIDTAKGNNVVHTYTVQAGDFSSLGGDITVTLDQLSDGAHSLALRAQDKADNPGVVSTATLDITVDTTAPTLASSTPSSSASGVGIGTSTISLVFDEALVESGMGFKISNSGSTQDIREIVSEAQSGNTLSYNSTTHTVTLTLSGSLQYGDSYGVAVYNAPLTDLAGNSVAIGESLLSFDTESEPIPEMPSALTLALAESVYASHSGADNDKLTNNNTLTVSGITASHLQYKMSSDDVTWTTVTPTGATYTMTLSDDTYIAGEIQFRQYDVEGYESTTATLGDDWTIDTQAPAGYVDLFAPPFFFGLGTAIPITLIEGDLDGEFNFADEFIEYTTDGSTWKKADSTSHLGWSISGVAIAEGGELGLRTTDTAGNLGTRDDVPYTVYLGDGYAGNHSATGSKLLLTLYGNDTIDVSGTENTVVAGNGNDVVNIQSGSTYNGVYGDSGSDTINVNGAYNFVVADFDEDFITISGVHNTVYGGGDADTITITGTDNIVYGDDGDDYYGGYEYYGGNGADTITITGTGNTVYGNDGNDNITVNGSDNIVDSGDDADTITITGTGNIVNSGYGADTFTINTLGGTILGDSGSDVFSFATSLVTLNGNYHGGENDYTDKLSLSYSGQELTLSNLTERISHFETIALGTNNKLTISSAGIVAMSDTDSIRFEGDSSDTIYADASLWESATWIQLLGYNKYQLKSDHSVTFTIDADIIIDWSN